MLHTIENEELVCTIESIGAEIRSLKNKKTGEEYIWQIDDTIWGSSSPVLFPAIGKIKDNKVVLNNKEYAMPKHGIIRNNETLRFKQKSASECSFLLESSEETKKLYPYDFTFTVKYRLEGNRLAMNYQIQNTGSIPMYFACGGHTAYACQVNDTTKISDYVVEFPKQVELKANTLGSSGLLTTNVRNITTEGETLQLSNTLFNEDALVFTNVEYDWIRLRKKDEKKGVIVRFTTYPHLAIWSKPQADYVCIEPWLGLPDFENESTDLSEKSTYKKIEANTDFSIAIETIVEK